jgi:hypothetical protein
LINASRNKHRYQRVVDAGNNSRRVWSAVKDLLHNDRRPGDKSGTTKDDTVFCTSMASFFIEKVKRIKSAISSALDGRCSDPLASDVPHVGPCMVSYRSTRTVYQSSSFMAIAEWSSAQPSEI